MKSKTVFICSDCGYSTSRWAGRCSNCDAWNTLESADKDDATIGLEPAEVTKLSDISVGRTERLPTGLDEWDRVLGSDIPGLARGSLVLLSGDPGIGKSTILIQLADRLSPTIYVSGEESIEQVAARARRIGIKPEQSQLLLTNERDISRLLVAARRLKPKLIIIDSLQTVTDTTIASPAGSPTQVREIGWRLARFAKDLNTTIIVIGHVTKDGQMAGPKTLEHLVDVVLSLEGDRQTGLRLLRASKNRYGSTEEIGLWRLASGGFEPVEDTTNLFTTSTKPLPGRSLTIAREGSRFLAVEIQSLTAKSSFTAPRRACHGFDLNRLNLILAVLDNRLHLNLAGQDVYLNVVGGLTVKDPGVDLAVAAAVISSATDQALKEPVALCGEIGLLGEVRPASLSARREKEAKRLGLKMIGPMDNLANLNNLFRRV